MDRERHQQHDDERVERLAARLHALDERAPQRLREAVVAAVEEAERAQAATPSADRHAEQRPAPAADVSSAPVAGERTSRGASASPPRRPFLRRLPPLGWTGAAGALALVALLLVLVLPGGGGDGGATPTVPQVAAVALQPAGGPAPQPASAGTLDVAGDGIAFPDWSAPAAGGWQATGARSDRVGDRDVTTVVYEDDAGRQVGYAIAAAPQLPIGGRYVDHGGEHMWVYEVDGATAVMWLREGRTCVVAARDVPEETLLDLAAAHTA